MYIYVDTIMDDVFIEGKKILISVHAVKRAREREIAYPDQVYSALKTGKACRFGKNMIRITKRTKKGAIICVGEDLGEFIIIKTIERGN